MTLMQLSETRLELTAVIKERDEWKAKFIQQNKDLGCEMMDPNGTIWDYAKKLQEQCGDYKKQATSAYRLKTNLEFWRQMPAQEMRLRCGEISAQEMRTVRAVLDTILSAEDQDETLL